MEQATQPAVEVPHWFGYERAFQTWWFPEHRGTTVVGSKAVTCQHGDCLLPGIACYGTADGYVEAVETHDVRCTAAPSNWGAITFLCTGHAEKLGFCSGCGRFEGEKLLVTGMCTECNYWSESDT